MPNYNVFCKLITHGWVMIEAENEEEAKKIAEESAYLDSELESEIEAFSAEELE